MFNHRALSSSNHIEWIIKANPTSRFSLYTIFFKHELCTETELRRMFISNRCKVNFEVVQCRYVTSPWQKQNEKESWSAETFY